MGGCQEEAEEEEDDDAAAVEETQADEGALEGVRLWHIGCGREGAADTQKLSYSKATKYSIEERVERVWAGVHMGSVWTMASNFCGLQRFVPAVHICERFKGQNGVPGCLRFCIHTSSSISSPLIPSTTPRHLLWSRDRLLVMDLHKHTFSYSLKHSNLGVSSQSALSIALREVQLEAHQEHKHHEEDGGAHGDEDEEDDAHGHRVADVLAMLVSFSFSFLPTFLSVSKPLRHFKTSPTPLFPQWACLLY